MINKLLYVFFISMMPVVELRGAIPYGVAMNLPYRLVYITAIIGNVLPVPFLIIFAKRILEWLSTLPKIGIFFSKIIKKADNKAKNIGKYELLGLFLFVAIPIPGTGAWTGSLIAATLRLRLIPSVVSIFIGLISSGIIMSLLSWMCTTVF